LIENKGTGMPLIQELLRAGIFAQEANPHRGSDKHMRTNAVADLFKSGLVWAPLGLRWVEQVRDEMAAFLDEEKESRVPGPPMRSDLETGRTDVRAFRRYLEYVGKLSWRPGWNRTDE
jgi:hypothetical protein